MCNNCLTIEHEAFKNISDHLNKNPIFTVTKIDNIIFLNSKNFNYRLENIDNHNSPILVVEKNDKIYRFDGSANKNYSEFVVKLCSEIQQIK